MSIGTIPSCPAVGYYGLISAQPATSTWAPGQSLQIVVQLCSILPPSSNVPIDVVAWANACYNAFLGDLGNLAYYPANQSQATITITLPPLLVPNMCPSGTYSGTLGLSLSVQDPRGTSDLLAQMPMTFAFPGAATTTTTTTTTTLTQTTTVIPPQTMTQTTTKTTTPTPSTPPLTVAPTPTPVTPTPTSKAGIYIAIGAAAIIVLAGLGYYLYSRRK